MMPVTICFVIIPLIEMDTELESCNLTRFE